MGTMAWYHVASEDGQMIQYLPPFEIVISIAFGFGIVAVWKYPWLMPLY